MSDKWGRKITIIIMSVIFIISFSMFFIAVENQWNSYIAGLLCGMAIGAFLAALDISGAIMCSESVPTNMRASVMTVQPIMAGIIAIPASLAGLGLINILGDAYSGWISLIISTVGLLIGMLVILFKVKETKGVDLEKIGE